MADYRRDPSGGWLAALRADALLVLPAGRADDLVGLWPALGAADAAAVVLDRLTAGGVTSAPGFALVVRERGSVRVVARGPLTVEIGADTVSGAGVSTWSERAFDGAPDVRVTVAGVSADAAGPVLPIVEGVVAASAVDWPGADARVAAPEAASPEPAASEPASPESDASEPPSPEPAASGPAAPPPTVRIEPVPTASHGAAEVPDERTMVPDEDTVVGFSRTERPRIDVSSGDTTIVPPPGLTDTPALGDHDGLTVAAADIRQLREARDAERAAAAATPPRSGRADDRLALRMPDGSFEPITGELLLGRAPAIGRVTGSRVPRPVVVGAGDPDISRTHLRVAVEGGTAVVTDLESRNGTHVVAPGQPPMRLRPSEPTPVLPETVIDLGGGWSIQVVVR
ncbi:FHA domain-containing protein [Agromyces indicus]|uniref:FHA domain-containing protein n=1 Tax=Agromyces indicus TaxID=758919 RepID=A0ABU1FJN2_9MICO|nr:FHA domain-containing protein [Agromyces indicus]MDR5691974.1 FHA domain-containing protein [Agromyces indicus]